MPATVSLEEGIGGHDNFPHDGSDGDFCWFSCIDHRLILGFEVWVEACGDESLHEQRLSHVGAPSADEAFTFPLARLSRNRSQTRQRCSLFVIEAPKFGHGCDELVGCQGPYTCNAGEDLVSARQCCIGCNDAGDFGIQHLKMSFDLLEALPALPFEQWDCEVLFPIFECGAVPNKTVACINEFSQLGLLRTSCRPDRRLQGGGHAGE